MPPTSHQTSHRTSRVTLRRLAAAASVSLLAATGLVAAALPATAATARVSDLLAQLVVTPESNSPAYDRDLFGDWADTNRDGCNTRREVLKQESTVPASQSGSSCTVNGQWTSLYDGVVTTDPAAVEIDHVVALAQAWRSGARSWNADQRSAFYNDLDFAPTLAAVTSASNQSKKDSDFARWRPPLASAQCQYATDQVRIKYRWNLSVDQAEHDALSAFLGSCGNPVVDVPAKADVPAAGQGSAPAPAVASSLSPGQSMTGGQWLMAPNGRYGLAFQADGNLVAYGPNDRPLWHAGTYGNPGATFTLQGDGNAVIYAANGRVLWHSSTYGYGGSTLRVQNDGNVVVYRSNGAAAWYSGWDVGQRAGAGSRGVNLLGR